eukprot:1654676-Ditylum_brightwellii.AAC.1
MVCDLIAYNECHFQHCIYSPYKLGSAKYAIPKEIQNYQWTKLQQWKEVVMTVERNKEDVLSTEEMEKQHTSLGRKTPLPLCVKCVKHK